MIDEKKLIQDRPEFLNEQQDISMQNEKGGYNKGWNDCLKRFIDIIEEQPKVGEWIPVEERLPNEEEFEKNYCRNHWGAEFIVMIKGANRPTSLYYKEGVWFDDDNNDYDVIAWQPLPEYPRPYSSGD